MVTSLNNTGVILIGGEKSIYSISARDIIELRGNSIENLEWTILEQQIQFKREDHVAFPVSNLFVNFVEHFSACGGPNISFWYPSFERSSAYDGLNIPFS